MFFVGEGGQTFFMCGWEWVDVDRGIIQMSGCGWKFFMDMQG